jgi:hypothetical protein
MPICKPLYTISSYSSKHIRNYWYQISLRYMICHLLVLVNYSSICWLIRIRTLILLPW